MRDGVRLKEVRRCSVRLGENKSEWVRFGEIGTVSKVVRDYERLGHVI